MFSNRCVPPPWIYPPHSGPVASIRMYPIRFNPLTGARGRTSKRLSIDRNYQCLYRWIWYRSKLLTLWLLSRGGCCFNVSQQSRFQTIVVNNVLESFISNGVSSAITWLLLWPEFGNENIFGNCNNRGSYSSRNSSFSKRHFHFIHGVISTRCSTPLWEEWLPITGRESHEERYQEGVSRRR